MVLLFAQVVFILVHFASAGMKVCKEHQHLDKGICICDDYFSGRDCENYYGTCNKICWDCVGPSSADCVDCVTHASKNSRGDCICDPGWYGADCAYFEESRQECHARCSGGCKGPTEYDCVACIPRAHFGYMNECICDDHWTGPDCKVYRKDPDECHPRCFKCTSPDITDCTICDANSHMNQYGVCICQTGWSGTDCNNHEAYNDKCHPTCEFCSGATKYECLYCVEHASRSTDGVCECDDSWGGTDCSQWLGECDNKCLHGCYGPDPTDCLFCVDNAYKDPKLGCVCLDSWGGKDCSIYTGHCPMRCAECEGDNNTDCTKCVPNAVMYTDGLCYCDMFYQGDLCDIYVYVGPCDSKCATCDGPEANKCTSCQPHATLDAYGVCQCDPHWSGENCGMYEIEIDCHPMCNGGCVGQGPSDCIQCVPHAFRDSMGECICEKLWIGEDCSIKAYQGKCHNMCNQDLGCTGPNKDACIKCIDNASTDINGMCICDAYYSGEFCEIYVEEDCDPKCNGCTGPSSRDCIECTVNAHRNRSGTCVCDTLWTGSDCQIYMAPCHPICDGCVGPDVIHCEFCVESAHLSRAYNPPRCVCNAGFTGEDCTQYIGKCDAKCRTCHGPSDAHCDYCITHAEFDKQKRCICELNWEGNDCQDFVGDCHILCDGCHGPKMGDCDRCRENSELVNGVCTCMKNWIGKDCQMYIGMCELRCSRCSGPNQCDTCLQHAHFEGQSCQCDDNWIGYSCTEYIGTCDSKCIGCHGELASNCDQCVLNAYRNNYGECQCLDDFKGLDCNSYAGRCSIKCAGGCTGPTQSDCIACAENADMINGVCQCKESWTGADCDLWMGVCHDTCLGCSGPKSIHCDLCIEKSHRNPGGECVCSPEWSDKQCHEYVGVCAPTCDGCYGPSAFDCKSCSLNAERGPTGLCQCSPSWGTADCTVYSGNCYELCSDGCHGPTKYDCANCVTNSKFHFDGDAQYCACNQNWTGSRCDRYTGHCDPRCRGCVGPSNQDCSSCIHNAERGMHGSCICEENWTGVQCDVYTVCDSICNFGECSGPGPSLCYSCVEHAHRDDFGICKCDHEWSGDACSIYTGHCDSKCHTCIGPSAANCIKCVEHSKLDSAGTCVCYEGWTGAFCDIWRGKCDKKCESCTGPTNMQCLSCVTNGYHDHEGACLCDENFVGDSCDSRKLDCFESCLNCFGSHLNECKECAVGFALYKGYCIECHSSCADCNDITANSCTSCETNSALTADGTCIKCHPNCRSCISDQPDQCLSCYKDSTLQDTIGDDFGTCICDIPMVRHPTTFLCVELCPTGLIVDIESRTCPENPTFSLEYTLTDKIPIFQQNTIVNSCHPPQQFKSRGAYFDGLATSLEIHNLELYNAYSIEFLVRIEKGGTLFTVDSPLFDDWGNLKRMSKNPDEHQDSMFVIRVSECGSFQMMFHPFTYLMSDVDSVPMRKWVNLRVIVDVNSVSLFSDYTEFTRRDIPHLYSTAFQDRSALIGTEGKVDRLEGFIYAISYFLDTRGHKLTFDSYQETNDEDCDKDLCLSTCDIGQFSQNGRCRPCHDTCKDGCDSDEPCFDCHSSCHNCVGPQEDDCTSCYCHARRSSVRGISSGCVCNDGYDGFVENCQARQTIENCHHQDEGRCYVCDYGFDWVDFGCEECNPPESPPMYGLSECKSSFYIRQLGDCHCDANKIYDGQSCKSCQAGCERCAMIQHMYVCEVCHTDYAFLPNSTICAKQIIPYTGLTLKVHGSQANFEQQRDSLVLNANFAFNGYAKFDNVVRSKVKIVGADIQVSQRTRYADHLTRQIDQYTIRHPFAHQDRGIYLNGTDNLLEITELTLFHSWTIATWIRSRGGGPIFSSTKYDKNSFFVFSIEHNSIRVQSTQHTTDFLQHVGNETWTSLSLVVAYLEEKQVTSLRLYFGTTLVNEQSIDWYYDGESAMTNYIGALNKNQMEAFHGFVFSYKIFITAEEDFFEEKMIGLECLASEKCMTLCSQYQYAAEDGVCLECPGGCQKGCYGPEPGQCPAE